MKKPWPFGPPARRLVAETRKEKLFAMVSLLIPFVRFAQSYSIDWQLGKAMSTLSEGKGLVLVLVTLE
jgi:hypothetical protein